VAAVSAGGARCAPCALSSPGWRRDRGPLRWPAALTHARGAAAQGLGFPDLTNMQTLPAFFNMIHQGVLDAPTFSIYLNPDPSQEPSGQIEFGGYDTARFVGPLNWAPVVDKACVARRVSLLSSRRSSLSIGR